MKIQKAQANANSNSRKHALNTKRHENNNRSKDLQVDIELEASKIVDASLKNMLLNMAVDKKKQNKYTKILDDIEAQLLIYIQNVFNIKWALNFYGKEKIQIIRVRLNSYKTLTLQKIFTILGNKPNNTTDVSTIIKEYSNKIQDITFKVKDVIAGPGHLTTVIDILP